MRRAPDINLMFQNFWDERTLRDYVALSLASRESGSTLNVDVRRRLRRPERRDRPSK
jgi:hypothetical protein